MWTFDQDRSTESNQEVKAVFSELCHFPHGRRLPPGHKDSRLDGSASAPTHSSDITRTTALQPNDAIRSVWTLPFALTYTVHLLPYSLRLSLQVENPADAVASLPFQALLHAYFRLPEGVLPPQVLVSPLHNLAYNDKVTGEQKVNEGRKVVDVDGPKGEVDRVYFRAPDELTIAYKGRTEMVKVKKTNLPDATVSHRTAPYPRAFTVPIADDLSRPRQLWNPGPEKGKTIKDMHENGVDSYICLEPGLTEPFQYLEAGQSWEGGMEISFA